MVAGLCGKCGSPSPRWALRCSECGTQDQTREALILSVSPTLSSRVGRWLRDTAMFVGIAGVVFLGAGLLGRIGNYFLGEWFGNILLLVASVVCLCALSLPFFSLPDIWRNKDFGSVSNWRASKQLILTRETSTLEELPEYETKFLEASIDLHDVKRVAMKQSWFGRALGYGDVLLYTTLGGQADMVFYGVVDPAGFAQRVEELVALAPALPKPVRPAAAVTAARPRRFLLKKRGTR
jgi:hypothetical protein